MTAKTKLLNKARNNPAGLSFEDFKTLLGQCGWIFDRQNGSHQIWISPGRMRLSIQPRKDGKAKRYQVEQFVKQIEVEDGSF